MEPGEALATNRPVTEAPISLGNESKTTQNEAGRF
jgi:hypothetical protein